MIASRLGKISGGAKIFRYGGEEFTAIFTGKTVDESLPHIERFRTVVGATPFVVRDAKPRRKMRKDLGGKIAPGRKRVQVTVSIGLAAPEAARSDPQKVIRAADKKLYQAKKKGRNQTVC